MNLYEYSREDLHEGITDRGAVKPRGETGGVSPGCTGVMDRIVLLPGGRVIFVELKQPGGRLSERQKWMADALARLGMDVRCLWNKEQVDKFLEEVTRGGIPSA